MSTIYLQNDFKSGTAYEYSKNEGEGFEKHESQTGKVSYRKYYRKGIYGTYKGISVRETKFGDNLSIQMQTKEGDTIYFQLAMYDQKDNFTNYAVSLIRVLPSMEVGKDYRVFPYAIDNEDTGRTAFGVSVREADLEIMEASKEKLPLVSITYSVKDGDGYKEVPGDIPAIDWVKKAGKTKMNCDKRDEALYKILKSNLDDKDSNKSNGGLKASNGSAEFDKSASNKPEKMEEPNLPF